MKDMSIPNSLVLDLGTCSTKSGWSTKGEPDYIFPTVVGRGRHKGAMKTLGLRDSYVGRQAQNLRGILSLNSPVRNGVIENWDDLETLWDHVWEREEASMTGANGNANQEDYRVLVSVPPLCPPEDWRRLGEILLEGAGVGGIYLANKSVLSMYGGGRTTGVCVDTGEDMTYVVPCWEGSPIANATLILKMGGKHVTDRLLHLLSNGKYSFPDDTYLLWKKRQGVAKSQRGLTVATRREVVREAKETFCRVAERSFTPGAKKGKKQQEDEEQVLRLPDGNIVVVGEESTSAPEVLFQPELAKKKCSGLHELVRESILRCDEKLRPRLVSNIMLTGGNSLLPGLERRLQKELEFSLPNRMINGGGKELDNSVHVRVQAQQGRENFTWDGGAHLCSLSSFQRLWLSKQDYMETGGTVNVQGAKVHEPTKE